ncbi:hypothetical protein PR048_024173 [Dryococelus australis]|uniref:Uncharacterized protein n=1 Tax=Dryococelus australis TaxID=614101 RepID=A0ABQ9GW91_9NEOP|nr:hypothetical protein PR048_024173 [Dryococelus australis]
MSDLLPSSVYYRFNPHLAEVISMVETDPAKVRQLEQEAAMYYRRNEETFEEVARALTASPSLSQRAHSWAGELWTRLA